MNPPTSKSDTNFIKTNHSVAVDGAGASNKSMNCYSIDDLQKRIGIDFGDRVQLNRRVKRWFRERYNEYSRKYGSSTCELTEAFVLCLYLAEQGIKEFLIFSPKVNFYAQPILVRYVKKRRRVPKLVLRGESEKVDALPILGKDNTCYICKKSYKVSLITTASSLVFLCLYCSKDWVKRREYQVD